MSDFQVITAQEELEALAREDADAVVLASEAGVARSVKSDRKSTRLNSSH